MHMYMRRRRIVIHKLESYNLTSDTPSIISENLNVKPITSELRDGQD